MAWKLFGHATTPAQLPAELRDRKSTRLNSSHGYISYAVFCLKKKKITEQRAYRTARSRPFSPSHVWLRSRSHLLVCPTLPHRVTSHRDSAVEYVARACLASSC